MTILIIFTIFLFVFVALIIFVLVCLFFSQEIRAVFRAKNIPQKSFLCSRCGKCCGFRVTLSNEDVAKIVALGHSKEDFVVSRFGFFLLLKREGGKCVFYKESEGSGLCSIHDSRPALCARFPYCSYLSFPAADPRCPVIASGGAIEK